MSFIIVCLLSPTVSLKHAVSTVHWHTLEGLELVWHGVGAQCIFAEWMNMWERSGSARSLWLTPCGPFSCLLPQHFCWLFSRCRLRVSFSQPLVFLWHLAQTFSRLPIILQGDPCWSEFRWAPARSLSLWWPTCGPGSTRSPFTLIREASWLPVQSALSSVQLIVLHPKKHIALPPGNI